LRVYLLCSDLLGGFESWFSFECLVGWLFVALVNCVCVCFVLCAVLVGWFCFSMFVIVLHILFVCFYLFIVVFVGSVDVVFC